MKILHTADWHLGKKLKGRDRLQEQQIVLENLINYVEENSIDLIIIAGDVYDVYSPSADSEELFYNTIKNLSNGKRAVVVLSGNHDDKDRLFASKVLAEKFGVYFAVEDEYKPKKLENISLLKSGNGYFIFEDNLGETVYLSTLNYPTEAILNKNCGQFEEYSQKINYLIEQSFNGAKNDGFIINKNYSKILATHLFMLGGNSGQEERNIELGGARIFDNSYINEDVIYTALGHLHKRQTVSSSKNIYYSGSLLKYSFDEVNINKSFNVFEVKNCKIVNFESVDFVGLKELINLEANSFNEAVEKIKENFEKYVSLKLYLTEPLTQEESKILFATFSNVLEIQLITNNKLQNNYVDRRKLNDKDLYIEFYKQTFGEIPSNELVELYLELLNNGEELEN